MNLWGVWYFKSWIAILTTYIHHNKGPDYTLCLSKDRSHRSLILTILHSRQPTLRLLHNLAMSESPNCAW